MSILVQRSFATFGCHALLTLKLTFFKNKPCLHQQHNGFSQFYEQISANISSQSEIRLFSTNFHKTED